MAEADVVSEFGQALAHNCLSQELRQHEGHRVGLGGCRLTRLHHVIVGEVAVFCVATDEGVGGARRHDPVEDSELLEHLEGAGLDAFAARPSKRSVEPFDECSRDTAPR